MSIKNILRICVVNINRYITIRHCSQSFDLYLFIRDSVLLYSSAKKASRDIYIYYFHFYITATLFAYFLVCHLYIFLCIKCFYFLVQYINARFYSFVNLFATLLYYSQSLSLILTVAVAGSVVAINVLLTKRTVPTMSGSQAMPLLLLDNKPGMQSCSDELPASNRKTAVRVRCGVSSLSNTLSAGRITYHIALLTGNVTDCIQNWLVVDV